MLKKVRETLSLLSARQRLYYAALVALRALSGLLDVLGVTAVGVIILIATSPGGVRLPRLPGGDVIVLSSSQFAPALMFLLGIFILKAVVAIFLTLALNNLFAKIESEMSYRVATKMFQSDIETMRRHSPAEIEFAAVESSAYAFSYLLGSIATIVGEATLVAFIGITFFIVDPMATLFIFIYFAAIIVTAQIVIGNQIKNVIRNYIKNVAVTSTLVRNMISTFKEIQILNLRDSFLNRFHDSRQVMSRSLALQRFYLSLPRTIIETALIVGVVIFVGIEVALGNLESAAPQIGIFLVGGVRLMAALMPLQSALINFKSDLNLGDAAREALVEKLPTAKNVAVRQPCAAADDPIITITDLTFAYSGAANPAIQNLSLTINRGERVAIVGPSGSGKTTLVDLILGLHSGFTGDIVLNFNYGTAINQNAKSPVQSKISYVPQRPGIIQGTLLENIALGIPQENIDVELALNAIAQASLMGFVEQSSNGLQTDLGKHADSMSGGQLQRIGLARALYSQPELLVLDEATSALDAETESLVTENLSELSGKTTVLVIAHRLSTVQNVDKVVVIENGCVTGVGTFQEIRQSNALIESYVQLMSFDEEAI